MTQEQYFAAVRLSTAAAQKSGLGLPEILGVLEIVKISVHNQAERSAAAIEARKQIVPAALTPAQAAGVLHKE